MFLVWRSFTEIPRGSQVNRHKIVSCELSNRKKIFYDVRRNKNVIKVRRTRKGGVASANDWQGGSSAHKNGGGKEEEEDMVIIP
jgi:hypothetical protein